MEIKVKKNAFQLSPQYQILKNYHQILRMRQKQINFQVLGKLALMSTNKEISYKYRHYFWLQTASNNIKEGIYSKLALKKVSPRDIVSLGETTKRIKWPKYLRQLSLGQKFRRIFPKNHPSFILRRIGNKNQQ